MALTTYRVIEASSRVHFETLVEQAINDGWELRGGVSVMAEPNTDNNLYFQAVTKTVNQTKPKPKP